MSNLYNQIEVAKHKIRGFGYNTYRILVQRIKEMGLTKGNLSSELLLIKEKDKARQIKLKHTIYQAASVPPETEFKIGDNITIRPPTEEEFQHYRDMPDIQHNFGIIASKQLTIIEWIFSINLAKTPNILITIQGEDGVGEKITEMLIPSKESSYTEAQQRFYDLIKFAFNLCGNGNFIPVYIVEKNINPYYFGHKPNYIDGRDLTGERKIGINFSNEKVITKIKLFYNKLSKLVEKDVGPIIIATSRLLSLKSTRKTIVDKYIDGAIILEALLLQKTTEELRFRGSMRAALLLGTNTKFANDVYDIVKEAYAIRSNFVHGGGKDVKIKKAIPQAFFQIYYDVYLKCLDIYDSDSYSRNEAYGKNYALIFDKIDRSIFSENKSSLEDVLGVKFDFYEKMVELDKEKT